MPKTAPEAPKDSELRGNTRYDAMLAPSVDTKHTFQVPSGLPTSIRALASAPLAQHRCPVWRPQQRTHGRDQICGCHPKSAAICLHFPSKNIQPKLRKAGVPIKDHLLEVTYTAALQGTPAWRQAAPTPGWS